MNAVKRNAIQIIEGLPDNVTIDEILSELYFKAQVDAGLKELDEGQVLPHEEVKKRLTKWLAT